MYHLQDIKILRDKNASKAFEVPIESVKIVERIHRKKPEEKLSGESAPLILVRKSHDGFALVTGWRDYWRAVQNGDETIRAIHVFSRNRSEFISAYKRRIAIADIIVPDEFIKHPPKENKTRNIERYYRRNGVWDKPIILGKGNVLRDGYARYLVAKKLGLEEVPYVR